LAAFRKGLTRNPLKGSGGAWIIQPENRRYLSGFKAEDTQFTESSGSLLIDQNHTILITDSRYTLEARKEASDFQVQTLKQDLIEDFPHLAHGLGMEKMGFEQNYLTWGLHSKIEERFKSLSPPISFVPLDDPVEKLREVKDARNSSESSNLASLREKWHGSLKALPGRPGQMGCHFRQ